MPQTMKVVAVPQAGAALTLAQRELPNPTPGTVRIKVEACGICHSDAFVKEGHWPGLAYPRVPGHEVAGVVDAIGEGVASWKAGDRVGVGWHGDHCGRCDACRRGCFIDCSRLQITGFSFDGGYEQYMIAPEKGLARIPDGLPPAEAAPLLCAGVTTFNSLRHSGAMPGDLVAVQGIGGLGHLAVQFARHFGFHVVALSRGKDKEDLAAHLGAHRYIDADRADPGQELAKLGGARVILATAPNSRAISSLMGGLSSDGKLVVIAAAPDSIEVSPIQLIPGRRSIQGWPSGTSSDSEDTMNFCARTGIRPMIEEYRLEEAARGFERMIRNQVRFRAVLVNWR